MNKVKVFFSYLRNNGLQVALNRTFRYLNARKRRANINKGSISKKPLDVMTSVQDVLAADFIQNPYHRPDLVRKSALNIGWVLSPISVGSGGQSTIARFARSLQEKGHEVTFYIYESFSQQPSAVAHQLLKEHFGINVKCAPLSDASSDDLDTVFATGWETAYPVFNMKTKAHKMYFVQDFEPMFYGTGSKAVLAENTYRFGFYGITAGKWLTRKVSNYGMPADYFDFGADLDIYRPMTGNQKKKQICFYARPVTERRAFEIGILALSQFHKRHPDYKIVMFGWDVSDYDIPFLYENRGIIKPSELASIYHESVACLVLSLTNASLLPMELLAAGCIPVMNEGDNNRLVIGEVKGIEYCLNAPLELAKGLDKAVSILRIDTVSRELAESVREKSWSDSYEKFEKIILREVTGMEASE